jgi:hypothetical protein
MAAKHKFSNFPSQFDCKSIETLDLNRTFHKKYRRRFFFSKFQNGGLNGDGAINHCFFLLALTQPFFNRI